MRAEIIEELSYRERVSIFRDRFHAGKLLAGKLQKHAGKENVILLAIPAGGFPVGCVVARELGVLMDPIIVRKVQVPWDPEAGFGALTWDGETVINEPLVRALGLTEKMIGESIAKTKIAIEERLRRLRGDRPMPDLTGKVVILVDDGLASGFTMLAAVRSTRKRKPERVVVAVPTASLRAIELLATEVDEIVCLNIRSGLIYAVADAYEKWYDLTDEEVVKIFKEAKEPHAVP